MLCVIVLGVSAVGCTQKVPSDGSSSAADPSVSGTADPEATNPTASGDQSTASTDLTVTEPGGTATTNSGDGQKTNAPQKTQSGDTKNPSQVATSSNPAQTGKKLFDKRSGVTGQVTLFIPWDTSGNTDFQKIVEGFKKEYPGTSVKVITGEWGTRDIKLTQLIRSGSSPDYVPTGVFDFPRRAIKEMLMPLDDKIQVTDTLDTYLMNNVTSWNGKKYAIIGKRYPGVLYFNTTMLKNAAIVDTPLKLAKANKWTWQELKTMARKLTVDKNKDGKPDVYGFGTETEFIFPLAQNTDIVKIANNTAKLNIDDEVWRSSLLFYYDGVNKDKIFSPVRWSMWEEFANGNVAMYYGASGDAEKLLNKGMKNWDIAPFPKAKSSDKYYIGSCESDGFGVATGAKNPIGGIAFGEYQYNYYTKKSASGDANRVFTEVQQEMMDGLESRITWLYGYGMEDSFCQSFGNYMRKNGDFSALMEEMRPIWQKNLDDTLKGR